MVVNLQPLERTNDFQIVWNDMQVKRLEGIRRWTAAGKKIPGGILHVIRWEFLRCYVAITFNLLLVVGMIALMLVFGFLYQRAWPSYIIPILVLVFSLMALINGSIEYSWLCKATSHYKTDLENGFTSVPPFLVRIYRNMLQKQVGHNWFMIAFLSYGSLFTFLLWFFKDRSWWIFDFKTWFKAAFWDPTVVVYILIGVIVLTISLYFLSTLLRKRRLLEIDAYYGEPIMAAAEVDSVKKVRSRLYLRLYLLSLLILLVLPLFLKLIVRLIRKK